METKQKKELINFMIWYKNYVPIGTLKDSETLVNEYLKSKEQSKYCECVIPDKLIFGICLRCGKKIETSH